MRENAVRAIAGAVIAVILVAFACIQFASDAFSAGAAAPGSLPSHVPIRVALATYRMIGRFAPAPYVEATLARYELQHGDIEGAQRDAVRLPPTAVRNELLGRIALARGDRVLAREYFFAAPDIGALQREVLRVARKDPVAAYALESRISDRLVALQTHPDAVAEAHWTMSVVATKAARRLAPRSASRATWFRRSLGDGIAAVQLSPLSEKYSLQVASVELALGDFAAARRWYHRVLGINPGSAQAFTGLRAVARKRTRAR